MLELPQKNKLKSLGAKFLSVEQSEDLETKEGYAKETSEDYKKNNLNY